MTFPLVILAAGMGSRLQSDVPKPLKEIHGKALIVHQINRFFRAGITRFYIVTGYQESVIQSYLRTYPFDSSITLSFISNNNWEKGNGTSVLAAAEVLGDPFYLTMTDHIFSDQFLKRCLISFDCSTLMTDVLGGHNHYLDLEDVTKVNIDSDGHILTIGKTITPFNCVDTGLFYFTPAIREALRQGQQQVKYSLSAGVETLAASRCMKTFDCGREFWMDVDTAVDFEYALSLDPKGIFL